MGRGGGLPARDPDADCGDDACRRKPRLFWCRLSFVKFIAQGGLEQVAEVRIPPKLGEAALIPEMSEDGECQIVPFWFGQALSEILDHGGDHIEQQSRQTIIVDIESGTPDAGLGA